jgi:protein-disulfide isomerase
MNTVARIRIPLAITVVLAAALIVAGVVSSSSRSQPAGSTAGVPSTLALVAGIPQQGSVLGRADAPVTLVEFADIQCPFCRVWEEQTVPTLVRRYVRTGKLRIEFRGVAILGPQSLEGLRYVVASQRQNRLWQYLLGLYARQGEENTGWVTSALLRQVGSANGLDPVQLAADASSPATTAQIALWARDGIMSTPSVFVGPTRGGRFTQVQLQTLSPQGTIPAIEQALQSAS